MTHSLTRRDVTAGIGAAAAGAVLPRMAMAQDATPVSGSPVPPDFRVVLHVSRIDHWPYALSNVDNLLRNWPQATVRVVVDGTGVYSLQGPSDIVAALTKAYAAGLELVVCPIALREHNIAVASVPAFANTSLGGVVALVAAQREGFVYIKP
jgi:intracellular sulfur oxidation DsrE/DsrF family protein